MLLTGLFLAATGFAWGCGGDQEPEASATQAPIFKPIDPAQAADIFRQPGSSRYAGVLPCADCAGIRTELMLLQDPASGEPQIYELRETYLGSMSTDGEKTMTSRGKWTIAHGIPGDSSATVYRLDGGDRPDAGRSFERLGDQELRLLDREGRRPTADGNHTLTRVAEPPVLTFPAPSATPSNAAPGLAPDSAATPAAMVTDMASGWPVSLRVGQEMTARLAVDRASGARWSLRSGSDGGIVTSTGAPVYEPAPGGTGGVEVFRFKAVKAGRATLTFDLRTGPDATAARTVSYPVAVQ